MKIITLTEFQFDNYAINHGNTTAYQSSCYGKLMQKHGFMIHYIGLTDKNNEIKAAALVLYKKIFKIFKYAYVPRGFLINYNDFNLLKLFTIRLRRLLIIQGFLFIKIDPFIIHKERDKNGKTITERNNHIINSLKSLGYIHQGYNKYFETIKPRCNAIINIDKNPEDLFLSLSKKTQESIKKAIKKGVTIHKGERKDIETLYNMIKNKHIRNLQYYFDYYDIFEKNSMIDIYYAKLNPIDFLNCAKKLYDKEIEVNGNLFEAIQKTKDTLLVDKKIESDRLLNIYKKNVLDATELTTNHINGFIIAATLVINYNNNLYFLLDGYNPKYKKFNGNHLLKWLTLTEYIKKGYKTINLNGISVNFDKNNKYKGLNEFKLGFGSTPTELIGEFDLPINVTLYNFFNKFKLFIYYLSKLISRD